MVGSVDADGAVHDGTLLLGDGRRLGYAQYGRPDGEPFFYFHGHPGSRLEARFAHQVAAEAGDGQIPGGPDTPLPLHAAAR